MEERRGDGSRLRFLAFLTIFALLMTGCTAGPLVPHTLLDPEANHAGVTCETAVSAQYGPPKPWFQGTRHQAFSQCLQSNGYLLVER